MFGGNNRAQVFFKQHGWTDGGKTDAKYTSRAADLYKQLLSKEVSKSSKEDTSLPTSPVGTQSVQSVNGAPDIKVQESSNRNSSEKNETPNAPSSPKAKASHSVLTSSVKKPLGAKKTGKTGGLGARKLSSKVDPAFF